MSGVLILIEGNDLSAQSKVTLISPVKLKVKLKTTSVCGRKINHYFKVFSSRWFGRGERKSTCSTGQNSAVLHLMCQCKLFRFSDFFFFESRNPAKERYGRYPETAISVNTFIIGFIVFFHLIVCLFVFRVTPACALTFMVCVIHFLRKQMTLTGK